MFEVLLVVYLLVALALIGLVLIQQGKGADMGASFGAGASNTMFGSSGAGNFLTRSTAILATAFFVLSIILGGMSTGQEKQVDEWQNLGEGQQQTVSKPADSDVPSSSQAPDSDVPTSEEPKSDIPN